jgi:hypothetical protein
MTEHARRKYRDGYERGIGPEQGQDVRGQRHFGDVEFVVPQHAEERFLDRKAQVVEVKALRPDALVDERARAVVVPAGEGESQRRHSRSRVIGDDLDHDYRLLRPFLDGAAASPSIRAR